MKNILFVVFLFAAGTAFSQTPPEARTQNDQSIEESIGTTDENIQTETDPEEGLLSEFDSEELSDSEPGPEGLAQTDDDGETEITPDTAKPVLITPARTEGPPQWAKDLRRGEIIAFGSFPFTFFFTKTFMDLYRMATHDWDSRYAPIIKPAGAIPMTESEIKIMLGIAVSSSVVVAVVDHFIVKHKRAKARTLLE
jgi:hypothetical protein